MPEEETENREEKPKKKRKLLGFLKREKKEEEPQEGVQVLHEAPPERLPPKEEEPAPPEKKEGEEYDLLKKVEGMLSGEPGEEPEPEPTQQPKAAEPKEAEGGTPERETGAPKGGKEEPKPDGKPEEAPKETGKPPEPNAPKEGGEKGKPAEGGKKKGKKEVSYEENVISAEEFKTLESKEEKKRGLLSRLKGGRKEEEKYEAQEEARPGAPTTTDLMLRIEKSEGKFEAVNNSISNVAERVSHLSEEIGELRSSLMERERAFRNVEKEFDRVKDTVENIEPAKFTKSLEGMKTEFTKSEAKLEGLDTRLASLKKRMDELKEVMDKVQGIKNLMSVADTVRKILEKMEEKKAYITKTASKTESMFVEVGEKLKEFEEYRNKIDSNAEMLYELMRSVDAVEAKMEKVATKETLEKVEERSEWLKTEYEDKVNDLKDIISELVSAIREGDIILKGGKKVFAPKNDVEKLKEKLDELRKSGKTGVAPSELESVHAELVDHIAESMRKSRDINKRLDDFESRVHQDLVTSRLELSKAVKKAHTEFGHDKAPRMPAKKAKVARKRKVGLDEARKKLAAEVEKEKRARAIKREKQEIAAERKRLAEEARKLKAKMKGGRKASRKKPRSRKAKKKASRKRK